MMDGFFWWGERDIETEIADDVLLGLLQPKRSLFYNRAYGSGIGLLENTPNGLSLQIMGRYEATKMMAIRNSVVSNGSNGPDRRAVTSQGSIKIESDNQGNVDFTVYYLSMYDYQTRRSVSLPIGVSR